MIRIELKKLIYLLSFMLLLSFFLYPKNSLAIDSSLLSGFDKLQESLELIARQNRLNIPGADGASKLQANLEKNLSKAITEVRDLKKNLADAEKFIDLSKQIGGSNSLEIIQQMEGLLGGASNLGNLPDPEQMLNDYIKLGELGASGFKESLQAVTQGFSGLGDLNSKLTSLGGKINEMGNILPEIKTNLPTNILGGGIGGNTTPINTSRLNELQDNLSQATSQAEGIASNLGQNADQTFDTDKMQEGFDNPAAGPNSQGEESVCDKRPASVTGEGNGNGVPTIEQEGPLLDLTGKLVEFVSSIKTINQETCYKIEQLYKKEFEYDKKVKEEAKKKMDKIKEEVKKQSEEGRKPANDLDKKETHWPTATQLDSEASQAGANYQVYLYDQSGTEDKIGIQLKSALEKQNENEKTDKSAYLARTTPTFDTKNFVDNSRNLSNAEYLAGLPKIANPKNNPYGQVLLQMQERELLKSKFAEREQDELIAGQGIVGQRECVEEFETTDGKKNCALWRTVVPAKLYGNLVSAYYTDNYKQASEVDDISDVGDLEANKEDAHALDGKPNGSSGGSTGGGGGITGGGSTGGGFTPGGSFGGGGSTGGGNTTAGTISTPGGSGEFNWQQFLGYIQGENTQTEEPIVAEPSPITTINIANVLESVNQGGVRSSLISWTSTNATECTVANDWIGYTEEGTTTPQIINQTDTKLATTDSLLIHHPLPFSFLATVSGTNQVINSPQQYSLSVSAGENSLIQEVVFEPSINFLLEDSFIHLFVGGEFISTTAGNEETGEITKQGIITKIKNYLDSLTPGTRKYETLSKISRSIDGNKLILNREVAGVPTSGVYEISCKGYNGEKVSAITTIDFTQ